MSATQSTPASLTHITPERLLVGDVIILFRLLVRGVEKTFGVSEDGSTLLTLIVIASVLRGARRASAAPRTQVHKARSSPNFVGDTVLATAAFKETVDSIAGEPSTDTSFAAGLILFAVAAHALRPAVAGSLDALRKSSRTVITEGLKLRARFAARGAMIAASSRDAVAGTVRRDAERLSEIEGSLPHIAEPSSPQGAASTSRSEELARLTDLHRSGRLTDEELSAAKARLAG